MSEENVELVSRWYELWSETSKAELLASMPRVMAFCHPEVEWIHRDGGLTHRGREAVREALERWLESFDEYAYELQRIVDCGGDDVLVVGVETSKGAMSGVEVRSLSYELLTIRNGQIVCFYEFHDERDAFEAAGLSE
jgi:ketosteroid isomerase-like protein